jgi:PTS system nitrogen regulatory IIA component
MTKISDYLDPHLVCLLDVETRDQALSALVEIADATEKLSDKKTFFEAVLGREKVVSTGIGNGVAIPHAKLPNYDHFFIAIGVIRKGLDWNAIDEQPVHLIFLIGGPDDKQTEYLQILSQITVAMKSEERRKSMLNLSAPEEIIALFKEF